MGEKFDAPAAAAPRPAPVPLSRPIPLAPRRGGEEGTSSHRHDIWKQVAVFPPDGALDFILDGVQFNVIPLLPAGSHPPYTPLRRAIEDLRARGAIERPRGVPVAMARAGDLAITLRLGSYGGGDEKRISALASFVLTRRLRDRLVREGMYPARHTPAGARGDNVIDPSAVAPGADLHALAMQELWVAMEDARRAYIALVAEVFGLALPGARVTLSQFELTWDAPCQIARCVPAAWRDAWDSAFVGAAVGVGLVRDDDPVRADLAPAVYHREPGAARGTKVLRLNGRRGACAKLYAKADGLVRFEAELTGKRARKMLGRAVRVDGLAALRADLETLGKKSWRALLKAQEFLADRRVLDLAELFDGFASAGSRGKVRPILQALAQGQPFHNRGGKWSLPLKKLRVRGWMRHDGSGYWVAAPTVARTLSLFRTRSRLDETLTRGWGGTR
jgi:hypothetical protein